MKKNVVKIFAVALIMLSLLIAPVTADNNFIQTTPINFDANDAPHWNLDDSAWSQAIDEGEFNLYDFVTKTILQPYTRIISYDWLILCILFCYLVAIWIKSNLSYMFIVLSILISLVYVNLPESSIIYLGVVWSLGLACILYKLYRNKHAI